MVDESATDIPIDKRIGMNVERLRSEQSWSQSELARRMQAEGFEKFNQMSVSRTEKGERAVSVRELMAFAQVFDVHLHDLLNEPELSSIDVLLDRLEAAHEELRAALGKVERLRLDIAYMAERVDWTGQRMPPYRAGVLRYVQMSAEYLVRGYMAELEPDEVKIPPLLLEREGLASEDGVEPGMFPFIDAYIGAERGVDQET